MRDDILQETKSNLERNGFSAVIVQTPEKAREVFSREILPNLKIESVSYADSLTLAETGILEEIRQLKNIQFIDTFDTSKSWEEKIVLRKRALTVDLFLSGSNAITSKGQIINLDMIGNRVNGIVFGPKNVVITVGVNKIVHTIEDGMRRIKEISAPQNAIRHPQFKLPCQKTGRCMDCTSKDRICNTWSIIEKCFPRERIKLILINREMGL
jgi:L-lactate utilization protein LutB